MKTGHRIKYRKVDAEPADEVHSADIIKGYEVGKGDYIEPRHFIGSTFAARAELGCSFVACPQGVNGSGQALLRS
jgi:hypothetical protein